MICVLSHCYSEGKKKKKKTPLIPTDCLQVLLKKSFCLCEQRTKNKQTKTKQKIKKKKKKYLHFSVSSRTRRPPDKPQDKNTSYYHPHTNAVSS